MYKLLIWKILYILKAGLVIVPFGIETKQRWSNILSGNILVIVPFGIET